MTTETVTKDQIMQLLGDARRALALFQDPVWAATKEQTDEEHLADYAKTLAATRAHYTGMPETTQKHWVMGEGDLVLAFTGNSPKSPLRAEALVGFLRVMPFLLDSLEASLTLKEEHSDRVSELIQHNTEQLMENRAQRATIRKLQAQVSWLMDQIPGAQVMR